MATDATGSPTPLGIPKYNTSADAPSGLGFNAAMDQIDALFGTNAPGNVLPATTLPVSPINKQIAILVDNVATPTWIAYYQYSTAVTDANKWLFIGGTPILAPQSGSLTIATTTVTDLTGGPTLSVPRSGIYGVEAAVTGANNSAATLDMGFQVLFSTSGIAGVGASNDAVFPATAFLKGPLPSLTATMTLVAGETAKIQVKNGSATSGIYTNGWIRLVPRRVA